MILRTTRNLLAGLALLVLSACEDKPALARIWIYDDDLSASRVNENFQRYHGYGEQKFNAGNFLNLQADGRYTSYFNRFDSGKWKYQDNYLVLLDYDLQSTKWKVEKMNDKELICTDPDRRVYRFNGYPSDFALSSDNPFDPLNNQWRNRAKHKEDSLEISMRLQNHFQFWEKYFAWGRDQKISSLDVVSTPSILDIYSNGFTVKYYDAQSPEWKKLFYDSADSWKAYERIYYLTYRKDINWLKTKNNYERMSSAFHQLKGWLSE